MHVREVLVAGQQITHLFLNDKKKNIGNVLDGLLEKETGTMALVTAYLARSAQFGSGHGASSVLGLFGRLAAVLRATAEVMAEARELHRVMSRKYPFIGM